ncbi:MAG: nucleotide exchange factor GrpE, partial [Clostridia bacterium]|nr:nucleotide exchange factor GrpE [Clostridia bacterium]
ENSEIKEKIIELNIDYKDRYLRAIADLENYKKRVDRERDEIRNISKFYVVSEFLSLYNNLKQAEVFIPKEMQKENWVVGIKMIADQFEKKLSEMGIEVEHTEGKKFDHNLMEAVSTESDKSKEEDLVLREISPCYKMSGKVIEHAKVIVNKIL